MHGERPPEPKIKGQGVYPDDEYSNIEKRETQLERYLDSFGKEGWELVSVTPDDQVRGEWWLYVFKRPVEGN